MTRRKVEPGEPGSWIVVHNWEKFQHYSNRDPKWIKNYTDLLSNDDYLALSWTQRGVLHGIWLAYAASGRQLRGDTAAMSRQFGERVTRATLRSLNHAGFIGFVASKPLATCYPRGREEKSSKGSTVVKGPARARAKKEPLPEEIKIEIEKLMPKLDGVDPMSRTVIEAVARGLPLASVAKVRESVELNGGKVGVGYVVNALKSERAEAGR